MKTEDAQRCMGLLIQAERLLDAGRVEDARSMIGIVRGELDAVDELTAPISLAWLFLEQLEKCIG